MTMTGRTRTIVELERKMASVFWELQEHTRAGNSAAALNAMDDLADLQTQVRILTGRRLWEAGRDEHPSSPVPVVATPAARQRPMSRR